MKRLILILASIAIALWTFQGVLAEGVGLTDSFEDGDFTNDPTWTIAEGGGRHAVNASCGLSGSNCLQFWSTGAAAWDKLYIADDINITEGDSFHGYYRFYGDSGGDHQIRIFLQNNSAVIPFYQQGTTRIRADCGLGSWTEIDGSPTAGATYYWNMTYEDHGSGPVIRWSYNKSGSHLKNFTCPGYTPNFDNFSIWDYGYTATDPDRYDWDYITYQVSGDLPPTVTLDQPYDEDHTNGNQDGTVDLSYNLTSQNNAANCTTYINESGQDPRSVHTATNQANGTVTASNVAVNETVLSWYVYCSDAIGDTNATPQWFVYDNTAPDWTVNPSNFFATDNSTILYKWRTRTPQVNLTLDDTYLFAYSVNFTNSSGGVVYSNESTGLTSTEENITNSTNATGWKAGMNYTAQLIGADDHTATQIDPYGVFIDYDIITFVTPTADVTITSTRMDGDTPTTEKLTDRYTFGFGGNVSKSTWTFRLESTSPLHYRGSLYPFPAFVTGWQWVDFDTGNPATIYEIRQEDAFTYEIEIETDIDDEIFFNSIGGLNTRALNYTFFVNGTPGNVENIAAVAGTTWAYVNWTITEPEIYGIELYRSGTLVGNWTNATTAYNDTGLASGTSFTYTVRTYTTEFDYNTTATNGESAVTVQTLFNGTLSLNIRNEITRALITDNITVNLISDSNNISTSTVTGQVDITNITTENYTIRATGDVWGLRDQYLLITQNQTDPVDFYLLNDTYRDSVVVNVRDQRGSKLQGAILKLLRYYGSTNTYETVQMATTTDEGQAVLSIQLYSAYYKFIVEYNDDTKYLSSQPENIYPSSDGLAYRTFVVDADNSFYESYNAIPGLAYTTTYNNATATVVFTWNDPSNVVTEGCLVAEYTESAQWLQIGPNCSSGAAGSVLITLPDINNTRYKYMAYLDTNTQYSRIYPTVEWTEIQKAFDFGSVGTFLVSMVIVAGAMLLSFSAVLMLIFVAVMLTGAMILGLVPFTSGTIIGFTAIAIGFGIYLLRR